MSTPRRFHRASVILVIMACCFMAWLYLCGFEQPTYRSRIVPLSTVLIEPLNGITKKESLHAYNSLEMAPDSVSSPLHRNSVLPWKSYTYPQQNPTPSQKSFTPQQDSSTSTQTSSTSPRKTSIPRASESPHHVHSAHKPHTSTPKPSRKTTHTSSTRPKTKAPDSVKSSLPQTKGLIVNSSACHLPDFDPWDTTILDVLRKEAPLKSCAQDNPVNLWQRGAQLTMQAQRDRLKEGCELECCLRSVTRDKEGLSDDAFKLGNETTCFEGRQTLNVSDEFVQVKCFCNRTKTDVLYEDFRAFIIPKKNNRTRDAAKNARRNVTKEGNLNVYMVGIDSVSRLNFMRYLPQVQQLLESDFKAIPMLGLTKVGVNTFPNLVPLLTGLTDAQVYHAAAGKSFDRQPFVWKQFAEVGYETMYSEDEPQMSSFNYNKKGFFQQPTDHYPRPMYLALKRSKHKLAERSGDHCVNDRLNMELQLQYLEDFMSQLDTSPQFALVFSNTPSHKGPLSHIKVLQPPLVQFLQSFRSSPRYNSSILIVFSDHGMRFGPVMRTDLGGYESRLPFFYIVLPPWYAARHPERVASLHVNSRRLITFFDVHATLRDVLVDAGAARDELPVLSNVSRSLFTPVPEQRSCADAGIPPHWCVCRARQPLPLGGDVIARAANATVRHINDVLLRQVRPLCAELRLQRVTDAFLTLSDTGGKVKDTQYKLEAFDELLVRLVTEPGRAEFEAVVRCYQGVGTSGESHLRSGATDGLDDRCRPEHRLSVMDVSRLNIYRGQSDCLKHKWDEKRFCYCKDLLA